LRTLSNPLFWPTVPEGVRWKIGRKAHGTGVMCIGGFIAINTYSRLQEGKRESRAELAIPNS
jgi:hypothetical protein